MAEELQAEQPIKAEGNKAVPTKDTTKVTSKVETMQAELIALELESKRLEIQEKNLNLEDLQNRIDERKLKRETIRQVSITNGSSLKAIAEDDNKSQRRCNHRKGGNGATGVVAGQGDSLDYAVIKHVMLNGDTWVRCQRCGKTWKPPIKADHKTDEAYALAEFEYNRAKDFPTKNSTSSAYQFRFSDNGAYFREVTRYTTLR